MPGVRFKGGSSTTTKRNIPAQTGTEAALQNGLYNYSTTGLNAANNLMGTAANAANGIDWTSAVNGTNSLLTGQLPSAYTDNITSQLNSMATSSLGNLLAQKAASGTIGSSQFDTGVSNIADSVSNAAANKYLDAINSYGNTLNSVSSIPSQLTSLAGNLSNSAQNMYNTMYSGRMGTSGATTTQSGDSSGSTWGAIGSLGSALITACFAAGTMISTPDGSKPIEKISEGDKVLSFDDDGNIVTEVVTHVEPPKPCDIVYLLTDDISVKTTSTQRFLTLDGFAYVGDIKGEIMTRYGYTKVVYSYPLKDELVYDFTVSGRNIFFANGLAAEGWD